MLRDDAFSRLRQVRGEYVAARFGLLRTAAAMAIDADMARAARIASVTAAQMQRTVARLEVTFVLRLFAEFEGVLRDYREVGLERATRPDMRPLMNAVARRRQMNDVDLAAAHAVREFRNVITHAGVRGGELDLTRCGSGLGRFLRWLPHQW